MKLSGVIRPSVFLALLWLFPGVAHAQAVPPAPAQPLSSPLAQPTTSAAPVDVTIPPGLEQRLDEIDQRARIVGRQLELALEAAAAKEKERAVVSVGPKGFTIGSADKSFQLSTRLLVQADARIFIDDYHKLTDNILLRRVRPYLEGTVFKHIGFRVMPDFGEGRTVLQDAYIDLKAAPFLAVRVGKFKGPVGLERLQSAAALRFVERAYPTSLVPNRDVGISAQGELWGGVLGYAVGVFDGVVDGGSIDIDIDDSKEVEGRLYTKPFASSKDSPLKGLLIGVAGTRGEKTGNVANPYVASIKSAGQNTIFSFAADTPATAAGTVVAAGVHNRATAHLFVPIGPLSVLGEYVYSQQRVARGARSLLVEHQAWQAAASFVLTGEDSRFDGVTPKTNFDLSDGKLGAIELVARYTEIQLDRAAFSIYADRTRSVRNAAEVSGGINWYLNPMVKIYADYAYTSFRGGLPTGDREKEHVVLARTQLAF